MTNENPIDVIAKEKALELLPTFAGMDASQLADYEGMKVDWLVNYIFAADQPTVFGAASKAGKTTQLADLAVALATGTKWLSHFVIPKRRKTLFITGESNQRSASRRVGKALRAPWRNCDWNDVKGWLHVEASEFPQLPNVEDQLAIAADVKKHGFEVVILDPIYRGLGDLDSHRFAQVADAIVTFTKACYPASVIMSHHNTKSASREFGPPTLEDLNGAGFGQSCGNWWLLGRNRPYSFDHVHDLSVVYGGRDEQSGLKRIVFREDEWSFEIMSGEEYKKEKLKERELRKERERDQKLYSAIVGVKKMLSKQDTYRSKRWIEERATGTQKDTRLAIAKLIDDGILVEGDYLDGAGKQRSGGLGHESLVSSGSLTTLNPKTTKLQGQLSDCR